MNGRTPNLAHTRWREKLEGEKEQGTKSRSIFGEVGLGTLLISEIAINRPLVQRTVIRNNSQKGEEANSLLPEWAGMEQDTRDVSIKKERPWEKKTIHIFTKIQCRRWGNKRMADLKEENAQEL